ncbi:MAG: class I SAM-dependent methyltransferase [Chitinophagaceae bacterium]|nr:class I SAM-dependent methyltransferase [Chitinophagaceae bacterium]
MINSSNDIYINGEYYRKNPDWDFADSVWKARIIRELLQSNGIRPKTVIETGCGAGGNLVKLAELDPEIRQLTGYDISPQAIELAGEYEGDRLRFIQGEIGDIPVSSDLMLVIDVLEHVDDFYGFLRALRDKSNYFVFHIPLDLSCRTIQKPHILQQQREAVGHIHYFTRETATWALQDTGYDIIDWTYTKPVVDIDPPDSLRRRVKKWLRNFSFALNSEWSVRKWGGYSIMVLAKKN